MQQPELGQRLTALRKAKNFTQEELVEKSHVSVRTIQRIESGEVLPRVSTIKILFEVLGEPYESSQPQPSQVMETVKIPSPVFNKNTVLTAALAGVVYLIAQIILGALDIAWVISDNGFDFRLNAVYIAITVVMVISFVFFARGFIVLSNVFGNTLLKSITYMLIISTAALGVLDASSLSVKNVELLYFPYAASAVLFGALSIGFGVSLIRLQDGMGELARIAGILEIIMGGMLMTVLLYFVSYVIMIPAVVVEILVLYRGYEYLSRSEGNAA